MSPDPRAVAGEVASIWRDLMATLEQRGMLHQRKRGGSPALPSAIAIVERERIVFVLDMRRLAGIPREQWLADDLWHQWRAALGGRPVAVADSAGLAIVVGREPMEARARRLPSRIVLTPERVPRTGYRVLLGQSLRGGVVLDLAGADRALLIGGASGSGKTRAMLAMVAQLVRRLDERRLRLLIVDPKGIDFIPLGHLPHLARPVAVEMDDVDEALAWAEAEMRAREAMVRRAGVSEWRRWREDERPPLLLVVVDEVADLAGRAAMESLIRLARRGRAAGVSLMVATQRPDAGVISPQVRANLPGRLGFRVSTRAESRIILDRSGAEALRVPGRCLTNAGGGRWRTVQVPLIEELADWIGAAAVPAIDPLEAEIARYAVEVLGGRFTVDALYKQFQGRVSRRRLLALAREWERRGWLHPRVDAAHPRTVAEPLLEIVGESEPPAP